MPQGSLGTRTWLYSCFLDLLQFCFSLWLLDFSCSLVPVCIYLLVLTALVCFSFTQSHSPPSLHQAAAVSVANCLTHADLEAAPGVLVGFGIWLWEWSLCLKPYRTSVHNSRELHFHCRLLKWGASEAPYLEVSVCGGHPVRWVGRALRTRPAHSPGRPSAF